MTAIGTSNKSQKKMKNPYSKNLLFNHQYILIPFKTEDGKMFQWFSICSRHRGFDATCDLCQTGSWVEVVIANKGEDNDMSVL